MRSLIFVRRVLLATVLSCTAGAIADTGAVNVNTADAQAIAATLVGVGLSKAEAIVAYRDRNGRFNDLADLTLVKGIGAATVEKNADRILFAQPD